MQKDEFYKGIISKKDVKGLLDLSDDDKENFLIYLMYSYLCNIPLADMNYAQRTLYLSMKLEDTCQADALPSLSEEQDVFLALNDMKFALEELGAVKTSKALGEFISLVPKSTVPEWDWFFEKERSDIIYRLDSEIGNYPDGAMRKLYIEYISKPEIAEELLK